MRVDRERLRTHVAELTATPRPAESAALDQARAYLMRELADAGWHVRRHPFTVCTEYNVHLRGVNLLAEHPALPLAGRPRYCIGAHVDSRADTPGADDNASGVASLLELARLLPDLAGPAASAGVELVAFDLEENGMLGGAEHARVTRDQEIDLRGMVSLEMLGYCDHAPNSQALPRTLVGLYPDRGNFIALIGNQNSTRLLELFGAGMRRVPQLPVETLQVPANGEYLQASRLSDHSPFWDAGYPALMITDTSFLRNPHYHQATDTPETLDFEFLHRVSEGCLEAVLHLLESPA